MSTNLTVRTPDDHCIVCRGHGCYWCGNVRTAPEMISTSLPCARCMADGWYYEYDSVGGRWQEHCHMCDGTGCVSVLVPKTTVSIVSKPKWDDDASIRFSLIELD